ncbi:LysR family transcriptional regulator [Variovorax sp. PCZ-1]|uniref:LysR family transcriptional regulator n=1 Tax=Variovorax sp. PCZ-1 TaxID=2835533 RepID=UPI001BCF6300|nr:LysR family transcriptional regulator [Variovorax sp. PCZ-1]MBS7806775.1 LysR family transcriptional regulator [Variovorax sp. PCZ-1]
MGSNTKLTSAMLTWLRAFEAVARQGSFAKASDELAVTSGAISQQVKCLEEALGLSLFDRSAKPISLTAEGRCLAPVMMEAFENVRLALLDLAQPSGNRAITLSCSPSFAMQWLGPRLSKLRKDLHSTDVQVFGEFHRLNRFKMSNGKAYAAIRYDNGDYPGLVCTKVLNEWLVPVASPAFLQANPRLRKLSHLAGRYLLHDSRPWFDGEEASDWHEWLAAVGVAKMNQELGKSFNMAQLAVGAALAGEGVAMGRLALVAEHLRTGQLIAPYPIAVLAQADYHFLTLRSRSAQVKEVLAWLLSESQSFSLLTDELLTKLKIQKLEPPHV